MVRVTLGNFITVALMAAVGLYLLKQAAPFVPFAPYRDLVGAA